MVNYFRGIDEKPFHLSVGAVVIDRAGSVACHRFADSTQSLMTETMEPGETIEQTLARGLQEEWGAEAELVTYIGSLVTSFAREQELVQKTTLYFLMRLLSINPERRSLQPDEQESTVAWESPDTLLRLGATPHPALPRPIFREAEIIQRLVTLPRAI